MDEVWLPVREFPDHYEVSNLGRFRRKGSDQVRVPGRNKAGYVLYYPSVNGVRYTRSIHRMVVEAFLGPIPPDMTVNHKNGFKTDNRVENLEVMTRSENSLHAARVLGKIYTGPRPNCGAPPGERHYKARLTWDKVRAIRQEYLTGSVTMAALAKRYAVHEGTIHAVITNRTWRE